MDYYKQKKVLSYEENDDETYEGDGKDQEEGYYGYGVWIIDNPDGQL